MRIIQIPIHIWCEQNTSEHRSYTGDSPKNDAKASMSNPVSRTGRREKKSCLNDSQIEPAK